MFNDLFKYYKSKTSLPQFTNVLDFNNNSQIIEHAIQIPSERLNFSIPDHFGFQNPRTWMIYELKNHPGLIYVKNPFTSLGQKYWIVKCLENYSKFPNKSNMIPLKQFSDMEKNDWWGSILKCCDKVERDRLIKAMRWVTLGYHYNWDDKIYDERLKDEFPHDLGKLCEYLAKVFKYDGFKSEAGIINYYPIGSTLAGHTDHSEPNLEAPLFSFSFGQSAIFLIGGKSKEDLTTPILLESGDIVIMSEKSRVCYHAVPRVFKCNAKPWFNSDEEYINSNDIKDPGFVELLQNKKLWKTYDNYLSDFRININIRQVLSEGQTTL